MFLLTFVRVFECSNLLSVRGDDGGGRQAPGEGPSGGAAPAGPPAALPATGLASAVSCHKKHPKSCIITCDLVC